MQLNRLLTILFAGAKMSAWYFVMVISQYDYENYAPLSLLIFLFYVSL